MDLEDCSLFESQYVSLEGDLGSFPYQIVLRYRGVSLPATCPWCEHEKEMIDHAIFYYPKVVRISRMADFLPSVDWRVSPIQHFLQCLNKSLDSELARIQGVRMIYITTRFGC